MTPNDLLLREAHDYDNILNITKDEEFLKDFFGKKNYQGSQRKGIWKKVR